MEEEIWKDIKGYEGYYQVSNLGRVKSLERTYKSGRNGCATKTTKEKILKFKPAKNGYLYSALCKDGHKQWIHPHRLVAEAFVPNPYAYKYVNHKDECKTNNRADNLEWCTAKYNTNYGTGLSRRRKQLLQLDLDGNLIREWECASTAEREGGYDNRRISEVCLGKRNHYKGFKWRYK